MQSNINITHIPYSIHMKQITITKPKRKVNRTKRAKVGSHGLKVYKNTYVYIAKETYFKQAPREEIVSQLIKTFNTDKSIRKMVKKINKISIKFSNNPKYAGTWNEEELMFEFWDYPWNKLDAVDQVVYHELVGHAFWHWAQKWRHEEYKAFNELAHNMPPVNNYVRKYEKYKRDYQSNTLYENEQHSAITELMMHGHSYHKTDKTNITEEQIQQLKDAWEALHY